MTGHMARTLAEAEAQTLAIPPRDQRTSITWIEIAQLLDGYNIAQELLGREVREWFSETAPTDHRPALDFWRKFSVMELRLFLFTYQRQHYWSGHYTDGIEPEVANDILDVLREKLEKTR